METKWFCLVFGLLFLANLPSNAAGVKYKGEGNIRLGQSFTISCIVNVDEPIRWTKNGKVLPESDNYTSDEHQVNDTTVESTLLFKHAASQDTGIYKCTDKHEGHHHVSVEDAVKALYDDESTRFKYFDIIRNSFNLTCRVSLTPQRSYKIEWLKLLETNQTSEYKPVTDLPHPERYTVTPDNELLIKTPDFNDAGVYRCRLEDTPTLYADINVASKVHIIKFPRDVMAVEGEKMTITCNTKGSPKPDIDWFFENSTTNATFSKTSERVVLSKNEDGIEGAVLTISSTERGDAGVYTCRAANAAGKTNATATVRVKDKYAALWPFLGICAEVFILCAVILVYEKRRNLPAAERDDSDTDHSPDRNEDKEVNAIVSEEFKDRIIPLTPSNGDALIVPSDSQPRLEESSVPL